MHMLYDTSLTGDRAQITACRGINTVGKEGIVCHFDSKIRKHMIDFDNGFVGWYHRSEFIMLTHTLDDVSVTPGSEYVQLDTKTELRLIAMWRDQYNDNFSDLNLDIFGWQG